MLVWMYVCVFVQCTCVRKGKQSYFLFRLLGVPNIWHTLKPAKRPDEPHFNVCALFQYHVSVVNVEVMLLPVSDEIWRLCASLCKLKLVLRLKPLKVTTHNVWICHMKRPRPDGTTLFSLLWAILSSALFPRIITHTILQRLTIFSVTLTTFQNKQANWLAFSN
jgi:hypothetical protein